MEIRPFSNSSEFEYWLGGNCYQCEKYQNECEIEIALAEAMITGVVSETTARRMGMVKFKSGWKHTSCKEIIAIKRWHIVGEINGKKALLFGPFDSIDKAKILLASASSIIDEVNAHTKINLKELELSIEQTDVRVQGQIDRFVEQLTSQQIRDAFQWTAANNAPHLKTIEQQGSVSQWAYKGKSKIPWRVLAQLPWKRLYKHEYHPLLHKESCLYFYLENYEIGMQAFKLLSEFNDYSKIKLEVGNHGMELVSDDIELAPTNKAWLILGEAQDINKVKYPDNLMVFNAYPGELTGSIKNIPDFDGTFWSVIKAAQSGFPIAVKKV